MVITAQQLVKLAEDQVGVKESPAGSNKVKYNTAYYGKTVSGSAYPWCCVFVWWLFYTLDANELFYGGKKTASCTTLMDYAKEHGLFVTGDYKQGDLIFFNWAGAKSYANHIGVCVSATKTAVTCIEGNTSVTNNDNGGSVMRRQRNNSVVVGAYRPKYKVASSATKPSKETAKPEEVTVSVPVLKQGMKVPAVKTMQIILIGRGYDCGSAGVDGSFGPDTFKAVCLFQKNKGLPIDGIAGPATWKKLLE